MRHRACPLSKNRGSSSRNGPLRLAGGLLQDPVTRLFAALLLVSCTQAGPITGSGETVYTGATKTIQFENQGGGFAPPPPIGPCDPQQSSFTLTVETQHLAWAL